MTAGQSIEHANHYQERPESDQPRPDPRVHGGMILELLPVTRMHSVLACPHTDAIVRNLPPQRHCAHHHRQCDPPQHSANKQCHAATCTHTQGWPNQEVQPRHSRSMAKDHWTQ
jgi:hypothetical protein